MPTGLSGRFDLPDPVRYETGAGPPAPRPPEFTGAGPADDADCMSPISANSPFSAASRFVLLIWLLITTALAAQIHPPLGPYTHPVPEDLARATRFGTNDPVVLTSYFYWYDAATGAHVVNADGSDALTDHPPTLTDFTFRSVTWHRTQLEDMIAAGIDVLLPVYWGEPSQRIPGRPAAEQPWSFAGLPPLVAAREALVAAGQKPPAIGMFYDTSTLEYNAAGRKVDLTTADGQRWFYESIRDFFSLIPARHWGTIEGRPIVFLYSAGFAAAHDQGCIDYVRQEFARDFSGVTPYIVREISWNVRADNTYAWGGALSLRNPGVAALGPGYDHSAVPGRDPLIVPREDGAFFERNWTRFLRAPSRLVHIETWNEYHEGTDIAASREYGRKYLELNRKFADLFKAGVKPPRPRGPYSDFRSVSVTLQATNETRGLTQFEFADGATVATEAAGRACRAVAPTAHAGRYLYFQIHDSFKWADAMLVDVAVDYLDQGSGSFRLEYDGPDPNAPFNGAYTASRTSVTLGTSGQWKTATFRLLEARFLNSQNGGADFRIALIGDALHVARVSVTRMGLPEEAGTEVRGWQQDFGEPLDPAWPALPGSSPFRPTGGVLRTGPAPGPTFWMPAIPLPEAGPVEMLCRVRLASTERTPNWLGGLAVAGPGIPGDSYAALFRLDPPEAVAFGLIASGDNYGPFAPVSVETNRWYWVRTRHAARTTTGYPDLWARVWPADGETPEPDTWTAWRDYHAAGPTAKSRVGLVAGQGVFEADWLLVQAEGLPAIVARPPALKPEAARLTPVSLSGDGGFRIDLAGTPGISYYVERSADLLAWQSTGTLLLDAAGHARYEDPSVDDPGARFYRARLAP